jgi:sulfur-carrier protein adenylyltransferase/sulfurtransferase
VLAEEIRSEFSHITVEFRDADVDSVVQRHPDVLDACDMILSATGSWAADGRLDAWQAASAHRTPIAYAWMEARMPAPVMPSLNCPLLIGFLK